jgi:hypothetical protein
MIKSIGILCIFYIRLIKINLVLLIITMVKAAYSLGHDVATSQCARNLLRKSQRSPIQCVHL